MSLDKDILCYSVYTQTPKSLLAGPSLLLELQVYRAVDTVFVNILPTRYNEICHCYPQIGRHEGNKQYFPSINMPRKQIRRMNFCSNSKTFDKSNLYNNYLTKGTDFTCCLDAYKTEHDAGSMYSFTLLQVGANRFVIN